MSSPELLRALAILLAICGAAFLSLGAQFQNDAVTKHHAPDQPKIGSLDIRQISDLLKRPRWLTGTTFLVVAVLLLGRGRRPAPLGGGVRLGAV